MQGQEWQGNCPSAVWQEEPRLYLQDREGDLDSQAYLVSMLTVLHWELSYFRSPRRFRR